MSQINNLNQKVIDASQKTVIAIDIGGSKIMAGAVSAQGEILEKISEALPSAYDEKYLLGRTTFLAERFKKYFPCACGVAIPGLADRNIGDWIYSPFSGIKRFPLTKLLRQSLGLPIFADNDVNACALGERVFGACREINDFLWITVSNGIGGGLILNGKNYYGANGNAGEIGHFVIDEGKATCGCGKRGCLEALASGRAISTEYKKLTEQFLTTEQIARNARSGEIYANEVFTRAGYALGKAICYSANLLNLQTVVLGGGVGNGAFDLLAPHINAVVDSQLFDQAFSYFNVIKTELGYEAALIGAASVAFSKTIS